MRTGLQLVLGGGEVEHPPRPKRLTYRQRELVAFLTTYGPKRTGEIPTHTDQSGALRRLERLGLVTRGFDGRWRAR